MYQHDADLIPKNTRVRINRVVKTVGPAIAGGVITSTQKQKEQLVNLRERFNHYANNSYAASSPNNSGGSPNSSPMNDFSGTEQNNNNSSIYNDIGTNNNNNNINEESNSNSSCSMLSLSESSTNTNLESLSPLVNGGVNERIIVRVYSLSFIFNYFLFNYINLKNNLKKNYFT